MRDILRIFPEDEWKYMKPGFYVTFWQLALYDIQYPAKNYSEAEEKLKDSLSSVNDLIPALKTIPVEKIMHRSNLLDYEKMNFYNNKLSFLRKVNDTPCILKSQRPD